MHLFRPKDVGRPKAEVAADFINSRIPGCKVVPYPLQQQFVQLEKQLRFSSHCIKYLDPDFYSLLITCSHFKKIQDFDESFYRRKCFCYLICALAELTEEASQRFNLFTEFHIIVCGLDSIIARRWMNGMLVGKDAFDLHLVCQCCLYVSGAYTCNLWGVVTRIVFSRYPSWAMKMGPWIPAPSSPSSMEAQRASKETLASFCPAWLHASTARWSCTRHRSLSPTIYPLVSL